MSKLKKIWSNRWVKFGVVSLLYTLWFVVWTGNPWLLPGIAVIYDIYISKYMYRLFWRKHKERKQTNRTYRKVSEWVEAIVFATVVATLIRIYVFAMFVIPTPSMEKSLLVGDYLLVSKLAYGPVMPNTPLSFPLVHNTLPLSQTKKSFVEWIKWPYHRLSGWGRVKRNDPVVFNFPAGDTIRIEHSEVWVNGEPQREIPGRQYNYYVRTDGTTINPELFGQMGIAQSDILYDAGTYFLPLTDENVERLRSLRNVREIVRYEATGADPDIFPNSESYPWNVDNFGPLWVPRKGATVALTEANLPLYRRIIETYEGNRLEVSDGQIRINGEPADSYTFAMDYYFMMGDNRHNSLDSRYWGFVPEDHIVGKPSFVWLSLDKEKSFPANIRWNRIFRGVK